MSQIASEIAKFHRMFDTPAGRTPISTTSTNAEETYQRVRTLAKIGGLNLGIYIVKQRSTGQKFVEKRIDATHPILLREIYFLRHLHHTNIVNYIDAFIVENPKEAAVYTEYGNYGSLDDLVEAYVKHNESSETSCNISEAFIWHVFRSLASALQYIHHGINENSKFHETRVRGIDAGVGDKEFVDMWEEEQWPLIQHRDIKLQNSLLRYGAKRRHVNEPRPFPRCFQTHRVMKTVYPTFPTILLADFGIACTGRDEDCHEVTERWGTPHWLPPEVPECSARGDVWALGAVIWSLCTLRKMGPLNDPPARVRSKKDLHDWWWSKEARDGLEDKARCGGEYSSHLDDTVYNCMRHNKEDRPYSFKLVEDINTGKAWAEVEGKVTETSLPEWAFHKPGRGSSKA